MRWRVVLSVEVANWYSRLTPRDSAFADRIIGLLAERGHLLRMPHSKPLADGLHELRFTCGGVARRITYAFDEDRMVIMLTTFRKQKNSEAREIIRARRELRKHRAERRHDDDQNME